MTDSPHDFPPPTASYEADPENVSRVLLLYSGGLDTSVMLKWIQDSYEAEVVCLTVNLGQPGEDYEVIAEKARRLGALEAGGGRLGGALGGADAFDLGGDERRHQPKHGAVRRPFARSHPELADRRFGHPELDRGDIVGAAHQRSLVGGRAGGDGEHGRRAIDQDQTGVERAGRGAKDLGQAGAGLDGVRDRGERPEVRGARSAALSASGQLGHPVAVRTAAATRG